MTPELAAQHVRLQLHKTRALPQLLQPSPTNQHQHRSVLILVLILGSDRGRGRSSTIKVSVSARAILKPQQNRHNLMGEIGIIGWY